MQLMTNKVYKVKWSFPIMDVCIVDVTSGIYINTDMMSGCDENYQGILDTIVTISGGGDGILDILSKMLNFNPLSEDRWNLLSTNIV